MNGRMTACQGVDHHAQINTFSDLPRCVVKSGLYRRRALYGIKARTGVLAVPDDCALSLSHYRETRDKDSCHHR